MCDKEHKHGGEGENCACGHGKDNKECGACGGHGDSHGEANEKKECCGKCDDKAGDGKCCGGEGYCACSGEEQDKK